MPRPPAKASAPATSVTRATGGTRCAVHDAIAVLQGKWTLRIVRALLAGPRGFNDLARVVGGCNSATLSRRLDELATLGLLVKRVESTMPPRTRYTLTRAGLALEAVVLTIERWGDRYLPKDAAAPGARIRASRRRAGRGQRDQTQ